MRAAGVYSSEAHRAYFAQLGRHFSGALHAVRCADEIADEGIRPTFRALVEQRVVLDDSIELLRSCIRRYDGAILVGSHVCDYLVFLARLNLVAPLTIYLRHSKDARKAALKSRWYRASGVQWIAEPLGTSRALGRLGTMAAALKDARVLFITPDLARKRDDGVPVEFFGREVYLPAGPAWLAERTGAPLFMLRAELQGDRQRISIEGPYERGGNAKRRAAVQARMQWYATQLEQQLRSHPHTWYLWGDKRWTRVFRNDPAYTARVNHTTEQ